MHLSTARTPNKIRKLKYFRGNVLFVFKQNSETKSCDKFVNCVRQQCNPSLHADISASAAVVMAGRGHNIIIITDNSRPSYRLSRSSDMS